MILPCQGCRSPCVWSKGYAPTPGRYRPWSTDGSREGSRVKLCCYFFTLNFLPLSARRSINIDCSHSISCALITGYLSLLFAAPPPPSTDAGPPMATTTTLDYNNLLLSTYGSCMTKKMSVVNHLGVHTVERGQDTYRSAGAAGDNGEDRVQYEVIFRWTARGLRKSSQSGKRPQYVLCRHCHHKAMCACWGQGRGHGRWNGRGERG